MLREQVHWAPPLPSRFLITSKKAESSTFHAVVWMDQSEAHVVMFDREHAEAQRIKSRSHHKHQGKAEDPHRFCRSGTGPDPHPRGAAGRPGPGAQPVPRLGRQTPCGRGRRGVDSVAADHPTDAQLVAMARQYFKKFDNMAADPSVA